MKSFASSLFVAALLILPSPMLAEGENTYLIHASEEQLKGIQEQFGPALTDYEEVPLLEMELSDSEKADLEKKFSSAEIYPNREYEVAADVAPTSFTITKSTPAESTPYTGKGVRVAVLDTGVDTEHPDLVVKGGICTAEECAPGISYDDNFGHGTHVAGIISGKKNSSGIIGMAPNVELYAIKAMDREGIGTTAQVTEGVKWAIQNDIDILNLSISISVYDRPLELMLQEAYKQGMLIVSAAGNEGGAAGEDTITYPGKFPSVIAVGAVNNNLTREANSSVGPAMEIAAPGTGIYSSYPIELDIWDAKNDGFVSLTGTSMAAPHITGVLALYKEQHPALANVKLREILQSTVRDLGTAGRDQTFGYGLVQYTKAVSGVPFVETTVSKGRIQMIMKNKALASGWSVSSGDNLVPQVEDGKWIAYRTKGTHVFNATYTNAKGVKVTEPLTVRVALPAFPDVTPANWFGPHISYLFSNNMMSGYSDGSFKPYKEITRGEAMILLGRAQGWDGTKQSTQFPDVGPANSASGYIQSAYELGIVSGFSNGSFKPYQSVTRAEMAMLLHNTYEFSYDASKPMPFSDVTKTMAAYDSIHAITQQGITTGINSTSFGPNQFMNRYSFAVFLARAESPVLFK
ncbi:S8 family peptidase [Planococcus chinensis]|uniref:S8 family serine peptidase n=1 Tax=Planococcus chinensis TaxID=272917 RepID=A0ABW4QEB5_9BACL